MSAISRICGMGLKKLGLRPDMVSAQRPIACMRKLRTERRHRMTDPAAFELLLGSEPVPSQTDRLVADVGTAFLEHVFDVAERQGGVAAQLCPWRINIVNPCGYKGP